MSKRMDILNTGAKLFAKRSYDAVGIRDIANRAHANSSMISYYFGGKQGLLIEIANNFIALYLHGLEAAVEESTTRAEFIDHMVRRTIANARTHRDIFLVGFKELYSQSSPEMKKLKEEFETSRWQVMERMFSKSGGDFRRPRLEREIMFKATSAMVVSDYLIGDGLILDDDALTETYARVISDLLKNGVPRGRMTEIREA